MDRQIPYFPSLLKPDEWYYYPVSSETTAAALRNRHLPEILPEYDAAGINRLYRHIRVYRVHPRVWTHQEYVGSMQPPSKRICYQTALDDYYRDGLISTTLQPFTKIEKMKNSKYKAPRLIQARKPIFNIMYGRYVKALEHILFKHHRLTYHFGKGTNENIADKIYKLSQKWQWKTEGDHKTFDAHVTVEHKKLFNKFLCACFPQNVKEIKNIGKRLLTAKCRTRSGETWTVKGTQQSGEVDTSISNTIINIAILKELMHQLGIKGEVLANGDDFILFTNKPVDIEKSKEILKTMNMETEMHKSTRNIHTVEFCANKLAFSSTGQHVLFKDIDRIYSKFGMTNVQVDYYRTYLMECAHGNWKMMKDTPIGQEFKRIYYYILYLEEQLTGQDQRQVQRQHMKLQYKYLEKEYQRIIKENKDAKENTSTELTVSMMEAYDEALDLKKYTSKLINRIKNIYTNYPYMGSIGLKYLAYNSIMTISHDTKQSERHKYTDTDELKQSIQPLLHQAFKTKNNRHIYKKIRRLTGLK